MDSDRLDPRGQRAHYACDPTPLGRGGFSEVFAATHKASRRRVALKRLNRTVSDEPAHRLHREIDVMTALGDEPGVMPLLDSNEDERFYVMPLADGDMMKLHSDLDDEEDLRSALRDVVGGLMAAHEAGYVHRDVTPRNLLRLAGRWVIADFGLVRGPVGLTTTVITSSGDVIGTAGFIAPEVLQGAHDAKAAADVYSLGRVITWAVSGSIPLAGDDSLPVGPYRQLAREATVKDPRHRLSLTEFLERLNALSFEPPGDHNVRGEALLERARTGERRAVSELATLADEHAADADLFLDVLARSPQDGLDFAVAQDPKLIGRLVGHMKHHVENNFGSRNFDYLNTPLGWIERVARAADRHDDQGLLEDAANALFEADAACVRFDQRRRTQIWLNSLRGASAITVARTLQRQESALTWYSEEGWAPGRQAAAPLRGVFGATPVAR